MKQLLLTSVLIILMAYQSFAQCSTNVSGTFTSCSANCNGSVTFTSTSGTPPYNLVVTGGPSTQYTSTYTWTNVCPGSYHYDVTGASSSCHDTGTVIITSIPVVTPPALNIYAQDMLGNPLGSNPTICQFQHIDFFVSPGFINVLPNVYTWMVNGNPVLTQNNVSNYFNVTFSTSTLNSGDSITLQVSWPNACMSSNPRISQSIQFTVTPNQPPSVNMLSSVLNDTVCFGNSITFTVNAIDAGTPSYMWYLDGAATSTSSMYVTSPSLPLGNHQMVCCITSSDYCDLVDPVYNQTVCDTINFYVDICTSAPEQLLKLNLINIIPNPASNQFTISNLQFPISEIDICNVLGEKVLSIAKSQKQISVDISNIPPGIYFIKVRGEKGESVAKFVKQ